MAQLQRLCGVKPPQLQLDVAGNAYEDCSSRDAVGSWDAGEDSRSMLEYVGALEGSNIWMYEMVAATGSLESQVAGQGLSWSQSHLLFSFGCLLFFPFHWNSHCPSTFPSLLSFSKAACKQPRL